MSKNKEETSALVDELVLLRAKVENLEQQNECLRSVIEHERKSMTYEQCADFFSSWIYRKTSSWTRDAVEARIQELARPRREET